VKNSFGGRLKKKLEGVNFCAARKGIMLCSGVILDETNKKKMKKVPRPVFVRS